MTDLPDLKIRHPKVEGRARFDLRRFLYVPPRGRDGRFLGAKDFLEMVDRERLEPEKMERLSLLVELKEFFEDKLTTGGSVRSQETRIGSLQGFFNFFNEVGKPVTLNSLVDSYKQYTEHLFHLYQKRHPELDQNTAYGYALSLSLIFSEVLDLHSSGDLLLRSRVRHRPKMSTVGGSESDKQNLEATQKMGAFLVQLVEGITVEAIHGELPLRVPILRELVTDDEVVINIRDDNVSALLLRPFEGLTRREKLSVTRGYESRRPVESIEGTNRWQFVNLRIQAEFLIFVAQTGMNVSSAMNLMRGKLKFKELGESLQVTIYKPRRGGEQTFPIYRSYKPHLKRYLAFVQAFFPKSDKLFPLFNRKGEVSESEVFRYSSIRPFVEEHGIPWIPPSKVRKTRENWILRQSGYDYEQTAEMHQHSVEVLRQNYDQSSGQLALSEITRFHREFDLTGIERPVNSIVSGRCSGEPEPTGDKPDTVVTPDCSTPSGCLWCKNFRGVDSFDHVWSLVSFKRLKVIESAALMTKREIPADLAVERLNEKIGLFTKLGGERAKWVDEAEARVETDGDYHPDWESTLELIEE